MNSNKVWFVTGASKGLGKALVDKLLSQGYSVAATSRNKKALGDESDKFLPLEMNLSDEKNIEEAVQKTLKKFKTIDVLVNNAGFGQGGTIEETTDEEVRKNYEVNVFGLLNVTRAVLPVMRKNRSGHVMNISSIAGYVSSFSGWGIYCSTKFAVSGITEGLHADVKDLGIKVTLVSPGYFRTNFLESDSMVQPSKPISDYKEARDSLDYHNKTIKGNQPGDPDKASDVMIAVSKEQNPPLQLFLGSDAVGIAENKTERFAEEVKAWKKVSISTDF